MASFAMEAVEAAPGYFGNLVRGTGKVGGSGFLAHAVGLDDPRSTLRRDIKKIGKDIGGVITGAENAAVDLVKPVFDAARSIGKDIAETFIPPHPSVGDNPNLSSKVGTLHATDAHQQVVIKDAVRSRRAGVNKRKRTEFLQFSDASSPYTHVHTSKKARSDTDKVYRPSDILQNHVSFRSDRDIGMKTSFSQPRIKPRAMFQSLHSGDVLVKPTTTSLFRNAGAHTLSYKLPVTSLNPVIPCPHPSQPVAQHIKYSQPQSVSTPSAQNHRYTRGKRKWKQLTPRSSNQSQSPQRYSRSSVPTTQTEQLQSNYHTSSINGSQGNQRRSTGSNRDGSGSDASAGTPTEGFGSAGTPTEGFGRRMGGKHPGGSSHPGLLPDPTLIQKAGASNFLRSSLVLVNTILAWQKGLYASKKVVETSDITKAVSEQALALDYNEIPGFRMDQAAYRLFAEYTRLKQQVVDHPHAPLIRRRRDALRLILIPLMTASTGGPSVDVSDEQLEAFQTQVAEGIAANTSMDMFGKDFDNRLRNTFQGKDAVIRGLLSVLNSKAFDMYQAYLIGYSQSTGDTEDDKKRDALTYMHSVVGKETDNPDHFQFFAPFDQSHLSTVALSPAGPDHTNKYLGEVLGVDPGLFQIHRGGRAPPAGSEPGGEGPGRGDTGSGAGSGPGEAGRGGGDPGPGAVSGSGEAGRGGGDARPPAPGVVAPPPGPGPAPAPPAPAPPAPPLYPARGPPGYVPPEPDVPPAGSGYGMVPIAEIGRGGVEGVPEQEYKNAQSVMTDEEKSRIKEYYETLDNREDEIISFRDYIPHAGTMQISADQADDDDSIRDALMLGMAKPMNWPLGNVDNPLWLQNLSNSGLKQLGRAQMLPALLPGGTINNGTIPAGNIDLSYKTAFLHSIQPLRYESIICS